MKRRRLTIGRPIDLQEFIAQAEATIQCAAAGESPEIDLDQSIPRFKGVAYSGGPLYWAKVPAPVILDLNGMEIPSQIMASGREHDKNAIVGNTTAITKSNNKLICEGVLSGTDPVVLETSRRAKEAGSSFPWQLTIDADYMPRRDVEILPPRASATVNGRQFTGPALIVRRSTLRMIDFTVKGADQNAKAVVQASAASGEFEMGFEEWVTSLGFDPATLSEKQRASLQQQYDAIMADETAEGDATTSGLTAGAESDLEELAKRARQAIRDSSVAEQARIAGIRASIQAHAPSGCRFKVNGQDHDLETFAIQNDWTPQQAELQALRESRPAAPAGHVSNILCSADVVTAALCSKAGVELDRVFERRMSLEASNPLPQYLFMDVNDDRRQRIMEAAHRMRGLSSVDFARAALQASGRSDMGFDVMETIQASFSSNSFGNIITSSAQITVLARYDETQDTTDWVDDRTPAPNFLAANDVRLKTPSGSLTKLAPGGTARPGVLADTGEPYKVDRYAESFIIDEQDLINDRLGLIMTMLGNYGEKAKRLRPDLVYALLLSNPTMSDSVALFHASHGNLQTGALTETNLAAAFALLAKATENSRGIDAKATDMLVPPSQWFTASGLIMSAGRMPVDTAGGPTQNMLATKKVNIIEEQRLENGVYDPDSQATVNGSSVLTYLIDRTKPPVKCYYLSATGRSPQVRRENLGVGQFGVAITTALDIGVAATRYQTAVRIAGA